MIRRSTLLALEVAAGLVATAVLGVGVLAWRLSSGPIELDQVKQTIETELSTARGGRPVRIGKVQLGLSSGHGAIEVRALDVQALDAKGQVQGISREVSIGLGPGNLLLGRLSVVEAHFHGGDVTITSKADGGMELAFGRPGSAGDIVLPPGKTDAPLAQRVNRALDGLEALFKPLGPGGSLRAVSFDNARLTLIDEKNNARWTANDAALDLQRVNTKLTFRASAGLMGPQGAAPFAASFVTDTKFSAATIDLTMQGARPSALAPSLTVLRDLTTPISLAVGIRLDRKVGVTKFDGDVRLGAGTLTLGGGKLDLSGGRLRGRYDLAADTLYINELALAGARSKLRGEARLQHASALFAEKPAAFARFDIAAPQIDLQMPGAFSDPLRIDRVAATGVIRTDQAAVEIEKLEAGVDSARVHVAGRMVWGDDGAGKARMGLKLDGGVDGAFTPQTVVRLWPLNLASSSRAWVKDSLLSGRLFNATIHADFTPKDLAKGSLPDDELTIGFDFDQASVNYIEGMTDLTAARGHADMHGNSFVATLTSAQVGDVALSRGKVTLPRLNPGGAVATYEGRGIGPAKSMVKLLLQAPIGLDGRLPFDPDSIVGAGSVDFALRRPLGSGVPGDATEFTVDGDLKNVGATAKNGDYAISQWNLAVKGDDKALVLSGPFALAHSTARLTWTERVRAKVNPSTVALHGEMDASDIISLGFPILKYATGPVIVDARSTGQGLDINKADVSLDFAGAAINLERGFWKKAPKAPATVKFNATRQPDKSLLLTEIVARGGGINVNGKARVTDGGDLLEADLPQAFLPGTSDGHVQAKRDGAGVLQVTVNGAFLNIGSFLAPEAPTPPSANQMLATTRVYESGLGALSPAMTVNADVDRLRMRGDADLAKAKLLFATDGLALRQLHVMGSDPQQKPFDLSIMPARADAATGKLSLVSADAGFAARAIAGVDNLKGGSVQADGVWTFDQNPSAKILVKAKSFLVSKVPAMAHLLSSVGSLTGMVETLNGKGITFTDLDAPMTMANGKLTLTDCRAAGPSLGITAKGAVNLYSGAVDIDGVLVPSYGLNSLLGNLPILGDLLVSRKGEGIFGITYSVHGPADSPRVGVNPLSAITPGILRRIFEPSSRKTPAVAAEAPG